MRAILAISALLALLGVAFAQTHHLPSESPDVDVTVTGPATGFFFAANGSDNNPCTQASPCQTVGKMASLSIAPGSSINFNGGDTFTGCWALNGASNVPGGGDPTNPIVVQSFGSGRATLVSNCSGNYNPLIDLAGVSGVTVQNLKLQGDGATSEVGILIEGPGDTITIQNNEVTGFVLTDHVAGEILVLGLGSHGSSGCNPLNHINILNNELHGASVTSKDGNGVTGFGCGSNISNIHYAGNHVFNIGGGGSTNAALSPNGLGATGVNGGVIEHNLIHDIGANQTTCGGPTGIITFNAGDVTIQFNEVYNVQPSPDPGAGVGCDWDGYDIDGGSASILVQYNYSHDNAGPGFNLCCGAGNGVVIRFNITENDNKTNRPGAAIWPSQDAIDYQIYNNTIFLADNPFPNFEHDCFSLGFGGAVPSTALIANNLCYNRGASGGRFEWNMNTLSTDPTNLNIQHNLYFPSPSGWQWAGGVVNHTVAQMNAIGKEQGSLIADPLLQSPGGGGICGTSVLTSGPQPCPPAYQLRPGSPALGAGLPINNNGGRNYYGNPISSPPNIGAF